MHYTVENNIAFFESAPDGYREIAPISIEIGGLFTSAQLKTLKDVKKHMAKKAADAGANAIINFEYGQRSVGFLRSLLQRDDVNWYGRGIMAVVPDRNFTATNK